MQKRKRIGSVFLSLALVCSTLSMSSLSPIKASAAEAPVSSVNVDWSKEYQTMDGFGVSEAFNKAAPFYDPQYKMLSDAKGSHLMDLMFSESNGIGNSIYRNLIGDGMAYGNAWYDGQSPTIEPEDGKYVWDQSDWSTKKATFDYANVKMMQEAMKRGVKIFYANAWTAPTWMMNPMVRPGIKGVLKTDQDADSKYTYYQKYAEYLVNYCIGYYREFKIPFTYLGATNETSPIKGEAYATFIENYLKPTLDKAVKDGKFAAVGAPVPKLVGPDGTNEWESMNAGANGNELSNSKTAINVFSTHLYGSAGKWENGPQIASDTNLTYPSWLRNFGQRWVSEYMLQAGSGAANQSTQIYTSHDISDATYWTNLMTNLVTSDPGFTSYIWWWGVGNNGADGSDLIRIATSGSPQGNGTTVTGEYRIFKRFYSFGQFSRFIDNGDVRIDATRVPVTGTNVVAFKDKTTNEAKIVITNQSSSDQNITFSLNNLPTGFKATSMVPFRTSASENMAKLAPISINNNSFTTTIPANSVVTFVSNNSDKASLNGLDKADGRDFYSAFQGESNDGASSNVTYTEDSALLGDKDYLKYANVNFADGSANGGIVRRHVLSMSLNANATSDSLVELHAGSADGNVVASFNVPKSSSSATYNAQVDTGDLNAYGHKDLYVVVRSAGKVNIDCMKFNDSIVTGNSLWSDSTSTGNMLTMAGFDTTTQTSITNVWSTFGGTATLASTSNQNYSAPSVETSTNTAYALQVSARSAGKTGVKQEITTKLVNGETYRVNGQFMPSNSDTTGKVAIAYTDKSGASVLKDIASREKMTAMRWNQLTGTFKWDTAAVDATKPINIVFYDDSVNDFYLDEVSLSAKPDMSGLLTALETKFVPALYDSDVQDKYKDTVASSWSTVASSNATQSKIDDCTKMLNSLLADKNSPVKTDPKSNVSFDISNAVLPDNVMSVSASVQVADNAIAQKVKDLVNETPSLGKVEKIVVNDLKLPDQNGSPITSFTGKIKVKMPIPVGMSGNLHVLWYDPNTNKITDMNATQQDGFLVFETDHFSYYAVVQLAAASTSSTGSTSGSTSSSGTTNNNTTISSNASNTSSTNTSSGNAATSPKTGDSTSPILYAALLGSALLSAIYLVISRKKRISHKDNKKI